MTNRYGAYVPKNTHTSMPALAQKYAGHAVYVRRKHTAFRMCTCADSHTADIIVGLLTQSKITAWTEETWTY